MIDSEHDPAPWQKVRTWGDLARYLRHDCDWEGRAKIWLFFLVVAGAFAAVLLVTVRVFP